MRVGPTPARPVSCSRGVYESRAMAQSHLRFAHVRSSGDGYAFGTDSVYTSSQRGTEVGKMFSFVTKKVRMGRISVPVWTTALALAVAGLAAGQAVGPVLTGSVTGTAGLTIEQAITLDVDRPLDERIVVSDADDAVTTTNDEGTEFTVAMELNVGQTVTATFNLNNASGAAGSAMLELSVPTGIDVEVTDETDLSEAQISRNAWLMAIPDGSSSFELTIEPKDDLKPGFYTISGRLVQISG